MSIVAYYARMDEAEVQVVRLNVEHFWDLAEMSWDLHVPTQHDACERLYIDKDWQVLCWLCSEVGRAEERQQAAITRMDNFDLEGDAFIRAIADKVEAMGYPYVDPNSLPDDPVLTAFQGRRSGDEGEVLADLGFGAAVFNPAEVTNLATVLNAVDLAWVRSQYDPKELESLDLPGDGTEEEFDEFFLPQFELVKALYTRASLAGQHVVVVMT